jgi:transposase-like protein
MERRRKLSPAEEANIVETYRAWDPSSSVTVTDLARDLDISRQTLYEVLGRNNEPLKAPRRARHNSGRQEFPVDLADLMAAKALEVILDRLRDAELRVAELERTQLRNWSDEEGGHP